MTFKIGGGQLGVYCEIEKITPNLAKSLFKILSADGVNYVYQTLASNNPAAAAEFITYYMTYQKQPKKGGPVVNPMNVLSSRNDREQE